MKVFRWMLLVLPAIELAGQTQSAVSIQVRPQIVGRSIRDGQVTSVFLAPRYATAIRMPEPVNSVVVGDPGSFSAEHSDREPQLVFVKPITPKPAQTNLLISTTRGLQVSLLLVSRGETKGVGEDDIDFLMRYKPSGQFIVQPTEAMSAVVPQTATLASGPTAAASPNAPVPVATALRTGVSGRDRAIPQLVAANTAKTEPTALDDLLERQRRAPLPTLYGQKPGVSPPAKELIRAGVSEVIDQGTAGPAIGIEFHSFSAQLQESLLRERLMATLSGGFGLLAGLLATLGLYGVIAYMVARRRNEIGIRIALGADRARVIRLVLREALLLLGVGLTAGVLLALWAARAAAALLFGLQPYDPVSMVAAIALLTIIALGASFGPARRAAALEPMVALRDE